MANLDQPDPSIPPPAADAADTPTAEPTPTEPAADGEPTADGEPNGDVENDGDVDACGLDDNEASIPEVADIIGGQLARDTLYALGDALLEGNNEAAIELVSRFTGLAKALLEHPDIKAYRASTRADSDKDWEQMLVNRGKVIELLGKAKSLGLADEAIMYLLQSMVDISDSEKSDLLEVGTKAVQTALQTFVQQQTPCGGCWRAGRSGWNAVPGPSPAPGQAPFVTVAGPQIDPEAVNDLASAYGVPGMTVGVPPGMTHAGVAAHYGTASVAPGAYIPAGAIQTPHHTAVGTAHGVGHAPVTVVVDSPGRTVSSLG